MMMMVMMMMAGDNRTWGYRQHQLQAQALLVAPRQALLQQAHAPDHAQACPV